MTISEKSARKALLAAVKENGEALEDAAETPKNVPDVTQIDLRFRGGGSEFQYHRLNNEESNELKELHEKDSNAFPMYLSGGESFSTIIWGGSYGPSVSDIEIINDETNEDIDLSKITKERVSLITGEENIENNFLDYFYITPGKVYGSITIDLHGGESFDLEKLKFKYMEFSLDGYPEKWGTIITEVNYDGEICAMETEDSGGDIYRCLLGYKMNGEEFEDYLVVHNSDEGEDFNWDLIDDIFTS